MEEKELNSNKVGTLLLTLRKEKGMTQKQVGEVLHVSDKAISKWERGLGCPDISLLSELASLFEVNIEQILAGDLKVNSIEAGNLKQIKFYVCPNCNNVINSTGEGDISCCGRKLGPLAANSPDTMHTPEIEVSEGEYYITFQHDMSKTHFISFVAYVVSERILLVKLYPEQSPAVRIPIFSGGRLKQKFGGNLYYYCTEHGLWVI